MEFFICSEISVNRVIFFSQRGRKQSIGHVHKFARNLLYRYLKRYGKSVRNDTSEIQVLDPAHCKRRLIKALIKILIAFRIQRKAKG